jgi:CspA family cold shock protein
MSVYPSFNTSNGDNVKMPIGTVKFFNSARGFGFIGPEDGSKDVFVHMSAVEEAGLSILTEGQKVEYEVVSAPDGRTAGGNLKLVD